MAQITDFDKNSPRQTSALHELGRDYCSDHLGRFFQNNYSLPMKAAKPFEIPTKLALRGEKGSFAICVMMHNHIVDLRYFSDIFPEWNNTMGLANSWSEQGVDAIHAVINDHRMLSVIKRFSKINEEVVIGRCTGFEFTPL
jgi:hypothetical protein